jgi:hypothetical protein
MAEAIPLIVVAATVVSAGVSAYSAYSSGQAQAQNARYQAEVARRNAQMNQSNAELAARNANYAEVQGASNERNAARRARQIMGAQEAAAAGNGLDVGSGSPLDLKESSLRVGTENIENAREAARRQAEGYRRQEANFANSAGTSSIQAMGYDAAGANYATAGEMGAFSSLLSGAASAGGRYADMQRSGVFQSATVVS